MEKPVRQTAPEGEINEFSKQKEQNHPAVKSVEVVESFKGRVLKTVEKVTDEKIKKTDENIPSAGFFGATLPNPKIFSFFGSAK